jgi:hypothetical protein
MGCQRTDRVTDKTAFSTQKKRQSHRQGDSFHIVKAMKLATEKPRSDEATDRTTVKHSTKQCNLLRDSDEATDKEIVKATYKSTSPHRRNLSSGKQSNLQICVISWWKQSNLQICVII